jgi:hypothetical protein
VRRQPMKWPTTDESLRHTAVRLGYNVKEMELSDRGLSGTFDRMT